MEITHLDFKAIIKKFLRGITRPRLLLELKSLKNYMNKVTTLYNNYPDNVKSFTKWREQEKSLFNKIYLEFIRKN